jgi:hypothetical protein
MSNQHLINEPKLGSIINPIEPAFKDAVHVAIYPAKAWVDLEPGEHVGLVHDGDTEYVAPAMERDGVTWSENIGIVDPYLRLKVKAGERFWLFLYPGTITALRHYWSHPAFEQAKAESHRKGNK